MYNVYTHTRRAAAECAIRERHRNESLYSRELRNILNVLARAPKDPNVYSRSSHAYTWGVPFIIFRFLDTIVVYAAEQIARCRKRSYLLYYTRVSIAAEGAAAKKKIWYARPAGLKNVGDFLHKPCLRVPTRRSSIAARSFEKSERPNDERCGEENERKPRPESGHEVSPLVNFRRVYLNGRCRRIWTAIRSMIAVDRLLRATTVIKEFVFFSFLSRA